MTFSLKKTIPNPNGNPNFRKQWDKLGETHPVKLPKELHTLFKDLATAINSGKISPSDLIAISGKTALSVVPDQVQTYNELLEKLEQFEASQAANWGKSAKQTGEFKNTSRSWDKFNEFKAWIKEQN
jgi:hypothetical protein